MQTLTTREVMQKFSEISRIKKIETLWDALTYMEQSNTRSRHACVCLAMGYRSKDHENWKKEIED